MPDKTVREDTNQTQGLGQLSYQANKKIKCQKVLSGYKLMFFCNIDNHCLTQIPWIIIIISIIIVIITLYVFPCHFLVSDCYF